MLFLLLVVFLASCGRNRQAQDSRTQQALNLKYARQFKIEYTDSTKEVTILQPWSGSDRQFHYRLSGHHLQGNCITIPADSVVCLSPTPFAMLHALGLTSRIIGVSSVTDIYNKSFYKNFKSSEKKELGNIRSQSMETLVELSPGLIFESATGSSYDSFEKLEELKLKTALFSAHTEPHPLGRAEWIKYMAAFFNREKEADTIFNGIEQRYRDVQKDISGLEVKPLVFAGYPWKDAWMVPGGNSYMAKFIEDAGGEYIYANDTSSGNRQVNVEDVLEKIMQCHIWLNPGVAVTDQEDLKNIPVINGKVIDHLKIYNNNNRLNEFGKNDFWESGIVHPDIILKDLARIFHPSAFNGYNLYYYKKIK